MAEHPRRREASQIESGLTAPEGDFGRQEIHDALEGFGARLRALELRPVVVPAPVTEVLQASVEEGGVKKLAHGHPYVRFWTATTEANLEHAVPPVDGEDLGWTSTDQEWWKRNSANDDWELLVVTSVSFGSDIQDVGNANSAGTGTDAALDSHVHRLVFTDYTGP